MWHLELGASGFAQALAAPAAIVGYVVFVDLAVDTADVGVVSASAVQVQHAQSHVRPWETLGALALVEWEPLAPLVRWRVGQ